MPLYYFSIVDSDELSDMDGIDLPNLDAAREHATTVAREFTAKREGLWGRRWSEWTMSVSDKDGKEVLAFPLDSLPE
jgi:hypothetical protein